jgi:glutaredoxin
MNDVVVYSASWCAGCKTLKNSLNKVGIEFTEVDIDTPEGMTKAKELNIKSIPVTTIGELKYIGSKVETIKEIIFHLEGL